MDNIRKIQPVKSETKEVPKYFIDKQDGSVGFDLGAGGVAEFCRVTAQATGTVNVSRFEQTQLITNCAKNGQSKTKGFSRDNLTLFYFASSTQWIP